MMMDTIGVIPSQNYHQEAAWGMDVLKVGASLGAGSLALSVPYKGKDSLIRLGGINMAKVVAEVVADGPLVGIIRLSYPEWKALPDLPAVRLTEEIKIWGGKYFYESNITVSNTPPGSRLVTGIVNLKSKTSSMLTSDNTKVLYTYDKQSENNDNLGMAIMIHDNNYKERGTTSNTTGDIRNTFTVTLVNLQQSSFRFYGAWSKSDVRFSTESDFRGFLQQESLSYSSPIIIK
jgi:hypothetical protein